MKWPALILTAGIIFCGLPSISSTLAGDSNDSLPRFTLECRSSNGFVIRHHLDMGVYTTRHFPCVEFNIGIRASGRQAWQQYYGNPVSGLGYWYSTLGNTKILGDVHALFLWRRFQLHSSPGSSLQLRIGGGLGYFKKIFDPYKNYKNLAIGSHFNANLQLLVEYRFNLAKNLEACAGIGLAHFSNGTLVTPNYGINVPHAGLALAWGKRNAVPAISPLVSTTFKRYWTANFSFAGGVKEIMPVLGKRYGAYSFSIDYIYARTERGGFGAGLELFWDGSERTVLQRLKNETASDVELIKPAIKALKQWNMGRMNLNFEVGYYLYEKETSDGSIYDKVNLQYFITRRLFTTLFLKTHYARADFIGAGVGVRIEN